MLKRNWRWVLAGLAMLAALAGPMTATVQANCVPSSGVVCPR